MSLWNLIVRSLGYYRRTNLAVGLGVAVATAVLVGSLLVGDSVKGSLERLALERLSRVDYALESSRYFRRSLAEDVASADNVTEAGATCTPAIILDGSASYTDPESPDNAPRTVTVPQVTLIGVEDAFWKLTETGRPPELSGREVAVTRELAEELGARAGEDITVSVAWRKSAAPMGSAFGRRELNETLRQLRLVLTTRLTDRGPERFTLRADRPRPRNIYIALSGLQELLWPRKEDTERAVANTLLVASDDAETSLLHALDDALKTSFELPDYQLFIRHNTHRKSVVSLQSTRLVLPKAVVAAGLAAAEDANLASARSSVYLANAIVPVGKTRDEAEVPYSIIAGLDAQGARTFTTFRRHDGVRRGYRLGRNGIVLNQWAADDLDVSAGDALTATFTVSNVRGELREATRTFRVADVVPLEGDALDDDMVPEFEGMTDSEDMNDWDPPFEIDQDRIRPKDEAYWDTYRTTPKAFVSLETLRDLWLPEGLPADAADWVTSVRLAPAAGDAVNVVAFEKALRRRLSPGMVGLSFRAVRAEALSATKTPTDFGTLFLSMSFFLVASAAGLIWLLFRLSIDRRAGQIGILLAGGFTQSKAARVLIGEAFLVAAAGVIVGVPLGILYAGGIITALTSNWQGAVAAFPLEVYVTWTSLVLGALMGFAVAAAAIVLSSRVLRKLSALSLLAGWRAIAAESGSSGRKANVIGIAALASAAVLLVLWGAFALVPAATAFSTTGGLLLLGLLALLSGVLQRRARTGVSAERLSLTRLALRGAARHWVRSLLTVGLLACATLLIVTVAAFRKDPAREHPGPKDSGTGGFSLLARSEVPLFVDLNTEAGRAQLHVSRDASRAMNDAVVYPFRQTRGGDISCLNLQRPKAPRVLGVPDAMIDRGGFRFSAHLATGVDSDVAANPWRLLRAELDNETVPAFADADTAQWQLKAGLGDVIDVPTPGGGEVKLRLVGLMPGSIFAGELLVSETHFTKHFDADSGYRFLLVACPSEAEPAVAAALRESLGTLGFNVTRTSKVLADYASVQNTYLSAFETLGGLGLVLATFGIVTVLLRSVIERRAELAMMLAVGFRRRSVVSVVLLENAMLLAAGVVIGGASALVAAAPQLVSTVADVRWWSLVAILGVTIAVGLASCAIAAQTSVRDEVIAALRSE